MPEEIKDVKDADVVKVKLADIKTLVNDALTDQAKNMGITVDENVKAQLKEIAEETYNSHVKNADKAQKLSPREDPKGGFKSMSHFVSDIINNAETGGRILSPQLETWEKMCAERKAAGDPAQASNIGDLGGFLIPTEFSTTVLSRARERSNILQKAKIVPMSAKSIDIPYIKGFNESQGKVYGNINFIWPAETADRSAGKNIELGQVELNLREAVAMVYLNNSLIKFSPISVEPFVTTALDDAMDFALAEAFIDGSGAGKPLGIMNSNCLVTNPKEGAQVADTFVFENVLQMFARHYGQSNMKEWYCNVDTLPQIAIMVIPGGGSSTPVFMPAGGATGQLSDTLLGRPIVWTDHAKTIGDAGDVILTDWSQYLVGQFQGDSGLEVAESIHLKFDFSQKALRFTFYIDGQPWWPSTFSPVNSVKTRSPFVVTAAR